MVQVGHQITQINKKFEDYSSLKKLLSHYNHVKEDIREFSRTTTDAAASLEENSAETIDAMAANKVLEVWQKTDQVATDGGLTGTVIWSDATGLKTSATYTLNAVNTTTHAIIVAPSATARNIESFELDDTLCADEVIIGNNAGTEIFGVIKVAQFQMLKTKIITTIARRTFIGRVKIALSLVTALVSIVATFTPVGKSLSTTKTFLIKTETQKIWEPCIELEPGTVVSWTIEDDNAAHPVATFEVVYVEAWN